MSDTPLVQPEGGISTAALSGRNWRLENTDGEVIAGRLILHPHGRVGLQRDRHRWRWSAAGGLFFHDWHGRVSTIFDRLEIDAAGRATLTGASRYDGKTHRLVELETLSSIAPDGPALRGTRTPHRRNLVILRANERSLHTSWPADIDAFDRSWDLCVSYYGEEASFPPDDFAEFHVLQRGERKFGAIHKLLHQGSPLWDYDYVMLPDDDLMMSWVDLNNVFEICREHALELAQPALTAESFWGQQITLKQPGMRLRFTNYVETMMPIFSVEALRLCAPTFRHAGIGWGLDLIWPALLGSPVDRIGVVDLIGVTHTRPVGGDYDGFDPQAELAALPLMYGVTHAMREFGGLVAG